MTTITYEEAVTEMDLIKGEWIDLEIFIDSNYIHPKEMLKVPNKISDIIKRENVMSARIKETWPLGQEPEREQLREKYQEVIDEFHKTEQKAKDVEKRLLGMQTPEQRQQSEKIKGQVLGNAVFKPVHATRTKIVIETTDKATEKTHQVMRKTFAPAFKGSREFKNGEITVDMEEG